MKNIIIEMWQKNIKCDHRKESALHDTEIIHIQRKDVLAEFGGKFANMAFVCAL